MIDQEPVPGGDDARVPPPIPSFASLRSAHRRSAIDLLVPPVAPSEPVVTSTEPVVASTGPVVAPSGPVVASTGPVVAPPASTAPAQRPPAAAPRPAEWGDLLALGAWLGTRVTALLTGGAGRTLAALRTRLRG